MSVSVNVSIHLVFLLKVKLCLSQHDSIGNHLLTDFVLFQLIDSVLSGKTRLNTIGELCKHGTENAQRLRQLSIVQQIENGLF